MISFDRRAPHYDPKSGMFVCGFCGESRQAEHALECPDWIPEFLEFRSGHLRCCAGAATPIVIDLHQRGDLA